MSDAAFALARPTNPLLGAARGIRVLDFSQIAAGPLCSMLLADLGAEVVKIEPPQGDTARQLGESFLNGESTLFLSLNRNKKSIALDLKAPGAIERIRPLIEGADVVIESFRPGVADRLGIGFNAVRARNPTAIYCSVSAFGQYGDWSARAGVDGVIQALSGLMSVTGHQGETPSKVQTPIADMVTGFQATIGILAALRLRDNGVVPGHVDISLFTSTLMLQQLTLGAYLMTGDLPVRTGSGAPYATPNEAYKTRDDYILIAAYQTNHWAQFCSAIDRVRLAEDVRFKHLGERLKHRAELVVEIEMALSKRSAAEWFEILAEAGITCAPIADYRMLAEFPPVHELGLVATVNHRTAGEIAMPGFGIGGASLKIDLPPPHLGEHDHIVSWADFTDSVDGATVATAELDS